MYNKKYWIGGGIIVAILLIIVFVVLSSNSMAHVDDINGDEITLNTLRVNEVLGTGYVSNGVTEYTSGGITGVSMMYEDYDYDSVTYSTTKLSGAKVLSSSLLSARDVLSLSIELYLYSGNMELMITDEDFDVVYTFDLQTNMAYSFTALDAGEYYLVVVGESANFDMDITREVE
jgi:hypothetical protein